MTTGAVRRGFVAGWGWRLGLVLGMLVAAIPGAATAQTVELASASTTAGMSANGGSYTTGVSRDGRFVVFVSGANDLLPGVTYPAASLGNVYLLDRQSGATTLISHAHNDPHRAGSNSSGWGAISADGNWIVFVSLADDLVPGYVQGPGGYRYQAYLHNRLTGRTGVVSHSITSPLQGGLGAVAPTGTCVGGMDLRGYSRPTISNDGSRIAFISCAIDLVPNAISAWDQLLEVPHAYVYTRTSEGDSVNPPEGTVELVDSRVGGYRTDGVFIGDPRSAGQVNAARVSGNGRWVVYETTGSDLLASVTDANGTNNADVYLYEVETRGQTLVSRAWDAAGLTANDRSVSATYRLNGIPISDDGRWVAFSSRATDLIQGMTNSTVPGVGPALQTWLFDRDTSTMRLVTHQNGSTTAGASVTLSTPMTDMSADGRYLAFHSNAKDLLPPGATSNDMFVLLYDRLNGVTTVVSGDSAAGVDCTDFTGMGSSTPHISPDGSRVAFVSLCRQGLDIRSVYDSWPIPAAWQVYSWERATGVHTLVTRKASYPTLVVYTEWGGKLPVFGPMMSTAGDVLAFNSVSTETVSGFTDGNDPATASYKVGEDAFLWVVPPPPTLTVTVAGSGSVTSTPAGIACPGDCSEVYTLNTAVTLAATPAAGWRFEAWSGNGCTTGQVVMSEPRSCTATFVQIPPADVAVTGQASPNPVPPGGTTVVTFTVSNLGPASATSVIATFVPPSKGTVTLAPGCAKGKGKGAAITCALGTMGAGTSTSLQFSVSFRRSVTGTFTTSLSATSSTPDNNPGNNTAVVQFSIGQ